MSAIALLARSRIRRGWLGLAAVAVLGGVVGGLVTATLAGERRGASAAERLIVETRASDLTVVSNSPDPADVEAIDAAIRAQPATSAVWPLRQFVGRTTVTKSWYYPLAGPTRPPEVFRPLLDEGRLPSDDAVDELAITRRTSLNTGLAVGDSFQYDLYAPEQVDELFAGDTEMQPTGGNLRMRVVGILRDAADIASGSSDYFMFGSTALYEAYPGVGTVFLVRLRPGTSAERFQTELRAALPPNLADVAPMADALEAAAPSLRVIRLGLWVMAAAIAAAGLLLVNQLVRRRVADHVHENTTLRSLGLDRPQRVLAGAAPGFPAAIGAAFGCAAVAIGASQLFPVGRPRTLDPSLGVEVNIAAIIIGAFLTAGAVMLLFLTAAATETRTRSAPTSRSASRLMASVNQIAPVSVALGIGLAGDRGADGTRRATARGVGTVAVGIAGLIASLVFIASLDHLTNTPAAYGIDYDLHLEVPVARTAERTAELVADPSIEMVAQVSNGAIEVSTLAASATAFDYEKGTLRPLVLQGRLPSGPTEICVGPKLAEELGVAVGSVVELAAKGEVLTVQVVGITLDPRLASAEGQYATSVFMTSDLLAEVTLEPPYVVTAVRFAPGTDSIALQAALDARYPWGVTEESVPAPPGAIINLSDVRLVPVALALFFAAVTLAALISSILGAARRHRRTLAIARALGLRPAQVRWAMRSLALSVLAMAGVIGGVVGAVLGNSVWAAVARGVDVLPVVRWPVTTVPGALLGLAVIAALAGTWSARRLGGRSTATALRAE